MVLEEGVLEGRKIFGNIIKYIKMTASSNFGNVFSVLVASAFLPFLPMLPIQLLVLNLLYDISQTAIPFDDMDADYLLVPRKWSADDIGRFMVFIGPDQFDLRHGDVCRDVVGVQGELRPRTSRCSRAAGSSRACSRRRWSCT